MEVLAKLFESENLILNLLEMIFYVMPVVDIKPSSGNEFVFRNIPAIHKILSILKNSENSR